MHCSHMHRFRQAAPKCCQNFTSCRTFHDSNEYANSVFWRAVRARRGIQVRVRGLKISLRTRRRLPFDFVKNCVHLKSLASNKRKHVDWYNELVNEKNISCRSSRSDTLDYSGKRILFTFLTGWFCACGSSSWIMKHANGNEAVLCQIIL